MARRRGRRRAKQRPGRGAARAAAPGTATAREGGAARASLVPWRTALRRLLDGVRRHARERHPELVEAALAAALDPEAGPEQVPEAERVLDDLIATPGGAGADRSIAESYAAEAEDLPPLDREQLRRWPRERGRGVFLLQRGFPDRLEVWDPIEGAGLTLHLLDRLPRARAAGLPPGCVVTAAHVPYVARLVALGLVEFFLGRDAQAMFREQVHEGGAAWHDPPPPPPRAR